MEIINQRTVVVHPWGTASVGTLQYIGEDYVILETDDKYLLFEDIKPPTRVFLIKNYEQETQFDNISVGTWVIVTKDKYTFMGLIVNITKHRGWRVWTLYTPSGDYEAIPETRIKEVRVINEKVDITRRLKKMENVLPQPAFAYNKRGEHIGYRLYIPLVAGEKCIAAIPLDGLAFELHGLRPVTILPEEFPRFLLLKKYRQIRKDISRLKIGDKIVIKDYGDSACYGEVLQTFNLGGRSFLVIHETLLDNPFVYSNDDIERLWLVEEAEDISFEELRSRLQETGRII